MLNHVSRVLMKRQVLNHFLEHDRLVPSLHSKLFTEPPNLPATLYGFVSSSLVSADTADAGGRLLNTQARSRKGSEACSSVFKRRGKMRAQAGSEEGADKRVPHCICSGAVGGGCGEIMYT